MCPSHLKDVKFCTPIVDQAAVEAKKKKELEEEVERVKKEYEEKQRKKKEKDEAEKSKDKDKDKAKDSDEKKDKTKKPGSAADKVRATSFRFRLKLKYRVDTLLTPDLATREYPYSQGRGGASCLCTPQVCSHPPASSSDPALSPLTSTQNVLPKPRRLEAAGRDR